MSRFEGTPAPECQSYLERLALAAPKPKLGTGAGFWSTGCDLNRMCCGFLGRGNVSV